MKYNLLWFQISSRLVICFTEHDWIIIKFQQVSSEKISDVSDEKQEDAFLFGQF